MDLLAVKRASDRGEFEPKPFTETESLAITPYFDPSVALYLTNGFCEPKDYK
jgi:hypothetical protein